MTSALLVIDLQNGVLEGCLDAEAVVSRAVAVIAGARAAGVPVIWIRHQDEDLVPGTEGYELAPGLLPEPGERRVTKYYRDAFEATALTAHLQENGAQRLVVCGAQSDFCIRTSTQRAAAEGYDVTLLADAHTTKDAEHDGVFIPAAQIVAHTNLYFSGLRYPGRTLDCVAHDALAW